MRRSGRPLCRVPKNSPGPRIFKVFFRQLEPVLRVLDYVKSLPADLGRIFRQQHAVALLFAPPHPAPELVQLRKPEAVGAFYQHDRGVGNIDAHLDDRRRDQDIQLAGAEVLHDRVFFRR